MLADGIVAEPEEISECLTDILNSGRHLLSLINDVLDISKIEAGQMELKRTVFDLREDVGEVCRSVAPLVAARRHTLIVDEPPVPAIVFADRQRIRQIILNLVSNAIKFTPDGGTIRIAITPEADDAIAPARSRSRTRASASKPTISRNSSRSSGNSTQRITGATRAPGLASR